MTPPDVDSTDVIDLAAYERGDSARRDRPRRQRKLTADDIAAAILSVLSGGAFSLTLRILLGQHGILGTVLWWYVASLVVFFLLVRDRSDAEGALDKIMTVVVWSAGAVVSSVLVWMLVYLLFKGIPELTSGFFTEDMSKVGPLTPGGGVKHALIGTLEQVGIATLAVMPLAVLTAVYLNEIGGRLAKPARFVIDAMSGLPSIIAGLLIYTIWVANFGFSGFAGSMALLVLMLPTVTRASEEILRTIPDSLREGALALGAPQWQVIRKVVVPTAMAGLVTATILGVALRSARPPRCCSPPSVRTPQTRIPSPVRSPICRCSSGSSSGFRTRPRSPARGAAHSSWCSWCSSSSSPRGSLPTAANASLGDPDDLRH